MDCVPLRRWSRTATRVRHQTTGVSTAGNDKQYFEKPPPTRELVGDVKADIASTAGFRKIIYTWSPLAKTAGYGSGTALRGRSGHGAFLGLRSYGKDAFLLAVTSSSMNT